MSDWYSILNSAIDGKLLYDESPNISDYPEYLHLGGLYNSFYPYDWLKITDSKSFRCEVIGLPEQSIVSIYSHHPNASPKIIKQVDSSLTDVAIEITLSDIKPKPGLRFTCQIESSSPIDLSAVKWTAITSNERKVKLGIVICTYNNEARLKENIKTLVTSDVWHDEKPLLILANNGDIQDETWLPRDRFVKFDQKNLGGSGGFGRGIYEIVYGKLKDSDITHILLMDDDVEFHPEVISRAIAFHKKSHKPIVIGGSMLKLEKPTFLHEAGANLNSPRRIGTSTDIPVGPINKTDALEHLGRAAEYDYNAWWFCSFPTSAAREAGLPLPIFIHGDDIEYGIRLNAHGYKVFCPGGISLWHESFENKHLTWIRYFDFRNALIRLTLHHDNPSTVLLRQLRRLCQRALIRNDYGAFVMSVKAFEDFCKGPEILSNTNFQEQIKSLNKLYHEYSQVESSGRYRFSNVDLRCQKEKKLKTSIRYLLANLHFIPIPSIRHFKTTNTRFPWTDVPYFSDITVELESGELAHYRRDLEKAKSLTKRLRKAIKKHKKNLPMVMNEWRVGRSSLTSGKYWRDYCKVADDKSEASSCS